MSFRFRNRVKTKKKRLHQKLKSFCPRNQEKTKKRFSPQFGTKFGRNFWDLFVLPAPFSSVQTALKLRWGDAESRWRDANSRLTLTVTLVPPRSPAI